MYEAGNEGQAKADRSSENEREDSIKQASKTSSTVYNSGMRVCRKILNTSYDLIEGNLNGGDRFRI